MTPISEMTNAELDELIFKLQGWVKLQPPAYPKWQHPGIDGTKLWFEDYIPSPTTDPRYAMELLEEMPTAERMRAVASSIQPLKRAISERYAQWKGAE